MSGNANPSAPIDRRLGRYELVHELGRGGMAEVFLARATGPAGFQKWFAIKRVHPHMAKDPHFVEMFLDEARIAAAIQHGNVASVFDLGEHNGDYFLAMEYLHGETLNQVIDRAAQKWGHVPYPLAARIIAQAARGLHHAHEAKGPKGEPLEIVHRDVSPQNIFLTYDGRVKVTDFGIAKATNRITHTQTGGLKGKVSYMAPEHAMGHGIDRRADLFALGIILWEATLGRRLFKAENDAQVLMRITGGQVPMPSVIDSRYPPELGRIVMKALARKPEDRFESGRALAQALSAFVDSTAEPAGQDELRNMMHTLLPDRFRAREEVLRSDPNTVLTASPESLGRGSESKIHSRIHETTTQLPRRRASPPARTSRALLWAILSLGLISTAAALWLLLGGTSTPGEVRVATRPSGAQVTLDGVAMPGHTPMTLSSVEVGRHDVAFSLAGFETLTRSFDAVSDETTRLSYELNRVQESPPTQIEPTQFEPTQIEPSQIEPTQIEPTQIEPTQIEPTQIEPEPTAEELSMTAPPPRRATITVVSSPWSSVRVDGRPAANTPVPNLTVPARTVVLRYQVQGQGPVRTQRVHLRPGQRRTVRLTTQ